MVVKTHDCNEYICQMHYTYWRTNLIIIIDTRI